MDVDRKIKQNNRSEKRTRKEPFVVYPALNLGLNVYPIVDLVKYFSLKKTHIFTLHYKHDAISQVSYSTSLTDTITSP